MNDDQILAAVKTDLQISGSAYDTRLLQIIEESKAMIIEEGAKTLDPADNAKDAGLVVMYADFRWETRKDPKAVMPRPLRWALNNRIFGEKAVADA